jgi:glucosamine-phosphate N-acetyltransferase
MDKNLDKNLDNIDNITDKNATIRKLNKNDYDQYIKLISQLSMTHFSEENFILFFDKIVNNNSSIWIIECNNNIIATGTILFEYKYIHNISKLAHIEDICVDEKFRGKGYGEMIINHLCEEANKEECYKINLYCNEKLEKFYGKMMFQKKGIQMAIYNI